MTPKIMLLGSGELGREFTISAKRLGAYIVACDSYADAPAMQMADEAEIFSMLDGDALKDAIARHQPDMIVPEVEAIRTEILAEAEAEGFNVVPSALATQLTMNRYAIRDMVAQSLGVKTSGYAYAETLEEAEAAAAELGFPLVVKPVMSSSGKGQTVAKTVDDVGASFQYAADNMRGDRTKVILEQFVDFEYEITLLTIRAKDGVHFCPPIGHRQERGDYQESWQPAAMAPQHLEAAKDMARKVVDALGGYGLFGVEFFVTKDEVIFSELSPRPHDTGMVTSISQNLSEFDLHARAIMGLPIPNVTLTSGGAASAVILADRDANDFKFTGLAEALSVGNEGEQVDIRIFGKPVTRPYRRMGVALAACADTDAARRTALKAAGAVTIIYN